MLRRRERGDTLIEVLFAVSVFSFVVVTALTIMNQGTAASQRSLEITLVRQQIDAQAETLRFMHDSYVAAYRTGITYNLSDGAGNTSPAEEWFAMAKDSTSSKVASDFSVGATCPSSAPTGSFILDTKNVVYKKSATSYALSNTWAQIQYDKDGVFTGSKGMWIEAIRSAAGDANQANTRYIDFHIRACWSSVGVSVPSTQGTIVRLYEPRG